MGISRKSFKLFEFKKKHEKKEIKFLEEYMRTLKEEDECALCSNSSELNLNYKNWIDTQHKNFAAEWNAENYQCKNWREKYFKLEMNKVDSILKKLKERIIEKKNRMESKSQKKWDWMDYTQFEN